LQQGKAAAFKPLDEAGDPFSQRLEVTIEADPDHFEMPAQSRAEMFFPTSKIFEHQS
jgi:hypothetical protein